jgi:hypothetical protein
MYYKTLNAKYLGTASLIGIFVFLVSGKFWTLINFAVVVIFCMSWLRYFFWVLQTRHLFLWFDVKSSISKTEEEEWIRNNQPTIERRLKRLRDLEMGYSKDVYSNSRHIQEMEVLAQRFGFRIFETLEMEFE